jgi:hypothetical protein
MTLEGPPMSGAHGDAGATAGRARRAPVWRGATGAIALAAWTVAGVFGAFLALLPAVLEGRPRGDARRRPADAPRLLLNVPPPPSADAEASRAREAFPG